LTGPFARLQALHAGQVAVPVVARVVLDPNVGTRVIDEARLPVPRIHRGIVDGDDVFELVADFADAFERPHFVAVGQAGRIEEGDIVEARGFHHQRVAVPMADRVAVVLGFDDQGLLRGQRPIHEDHADLMVHFIEKRDLARRHLENLERIGCGEHAWQAVGDADPARLVDDGALLQARPVRLALRGGSPPPRTSMSGL
jgi:hypothetical protein